MNCKLFFSLSFLFCLQQLAGQSFSVSGRITDAETQEPLPFVNLVVNSSQKGGISDINGLFTLFSDEPVQFLRVSYVGYQTDTIPVNGQSRVDFQLSKSAIQLNEVIILPGENPAHRMIDSAVANRKLNDPFNLNSFSYSSYSKFFITLGIDSLMTIPDEQLDSERLGLKTFFTEHYLFFMENFSERKFLKPNNDNEVVLASKVSGFSDPLLTLLNGQIQSFSFYKPLITISDKNYVNPISPGSTDKYFFLLQDTIYDGADTVYVISYRPRRGKAFDGLEGLLYIHTAGWALQAVTAEPADKEASGMSVKIRQNYSRPDGTHWFPAQLHTEIFFSSLNVNEYPVFGRGVTTLSQIKINPDLKKSDFNTATVTIDPDARFKDSLYWSAIRPDTLTQRETNTYHFIDSIGKKEHFDRLLDLTTTLMSGYIPLGPVALDINSFYRNNQVEGGRPGLGMKTSYRVSRTWFLYGYYGFGFRDKEHKFKGELTVNTKKSRQMYVAGGFRQDVRECGSIRFDLDNSTILALDGLRNYLINRIDYTDEAYLQYHSLLGKSWEITSRASRTAYLAADSVLFGQYTESGFAGTRSFVVSDINVLLRFSKGTQFVQSENYSLPIGSYSPAPVVMLDVRQSIPGLLDNSVNRTACVLRVSQSLKTKYIGRFSWVLQSGIVSPNVPLSLAFNAPASYRSFTVSSPNSFETMRMNEFFSTRFVFLFLRHSFESILFGSGKFSPSPELVTSLAWGDYSGTDHLQVPTFKTLEKGYIESGLYINRIINTGLYSLGFGAVYRYGPNRLDSFRENLTLKIAFSYAL